MKPPPFVYRRPTSVDEALDVLEEHGSEAVPLAGGQSLVPLMNLRLVRPAVLVDLNWVPGLDSIESAGGELVIGALVRQRQLERSEDAHAACPILRAALRHVGTPQTRNRGTVGGSVCLGDPVAELPTVCLAAGATFVLRSRRGERRVAAREFYRGPYATARNDDELLAEIRIPRCNSVWAFEELAHSARSPAIVAVAMIGGEDGGLSTAVAGAAPMPSLVASVDELAGNAADAFRLSVASELLDRCRRRLADAGDAPC
jgi:carbon-monoxide dehydrogenase medium subunit